MRDREQSMQPTQGPREKPLTLDGPGFLRLAWRITIPFLPLVVLALVLTVLGAILDGGSQVHFTQRGLSVSGSTILGSFILWMGLNLAIIIVLCLLIPMIVHELAHALALRAAAGVRTVTTTLNWRYFALNVPSDKVSPGASLAIALAGPLMTAGCGVFWQITGFSFIAFFCYVHLLALLPIFGDGREALNAIARMRASAK